MNLGTCPNCNEDVLLPNESAEFGYYVGDQFPFNC